MLRKSFLKICGLSAVGLTARGGNRTVFRTKKTVRGSAENLILVFLDGAPSQVDTFDLKVGNWTPNDFEPATFGNFLLPGALFPSLSQQTDRFSILRAISGNEAVHQRASYLLETSHTFNPSFAKEQPHIGSVMAYELEAQRKSEDILPTFLSLNGLTQGPGLLPSTYAAFTFSAEQGVSGLAHPGGENLFRKRYQSLLNVDQKNRSTVAAQGAALSDYHNFYHLGQRMMYEPDVEDSFTATENDLSRYGATPTGVSCAVAFKTLAKDRGTRVIQIRQGGWDMHYDIYDRNVNGNIYERTAELDTALAAMLEDLAAAPGKRGGTLLDETLVVVTGEFGRTPGALTRNLGRDHFPYAFSALLAGGGIVPNQAFGATAEDGSYITDPFWSHNRYITMPDLIATMYSSLGIDWTKEIRNTPSGRVYEYTPKVNDEAGYYKDIDAMFA